MSGIWSRTECYEVPLDRSLGLTWPESCSARMFCTPFVSSVGTWWTCFPRKLQLNTKVLKQVSRHIKMQKININHSYNHMKLLRWGAAPTRHPRSEIQVSNGGWPSRMNVPHPQLFLCWAFLGPQALHTYCPYPGKSYSGARSLYTYGQAVYSRRGTWQYKLQTWQ